MTVTLKGSPVKIFGDLPATGSVAPAFRLVNKDLKDVSLQDYAGKKKVLNIFPSIDTSTCATSTRKFNEKAAGLKNTVVLCVSADLPFAMNRFCAAEGLERVITLSTMRGRNFAKDYGVLIENGPLGGLCARAVVVVDEQDIVRHVELVSEIANEPDYESALKAAGQSAS